MASHLLIPGPILELNNGPSKAQPNWLHLHQPEPGE